MNNPPINETIFVASAGTGKTSTLMNLLTEVLDKETSPKDICFTTFSKVGAQEAIDRALVKNPSYHISDFTGFSTLHALCYRRIPRRQMLSYQDYKLLGELSGYPISGSAAYSNKDGMSYNSNAGDIILTYDSLRRNLKASSEDILSSQLNARVTPEELDEFTKFYKQFRAQKNKYDFTDQLEKYIEQDIRPYFEYVFVDEAQDLSPLQWDVIDFISKDAKEVFVAGDDKQSIFKFAGGDPSSLINRQGNRVVLDTSYRLPQPVLKYAERIAEDIKEKQAYTVQSNKEQGSVQHIHSIDDVDFSEGTWFLLCRNKAMVEIFECELMRIKQLFVSNSPNSLFSEKQIQNILIWEQLRKGYKFKAHKLKVLYNDYLPTGTAVARGSKKLINSMPDSELFDKDDLKNSFGLRTTDKWDKVFKLPDITKEVLLKAESEDKLDKSANIEISTIHATKGREADNVIILPDMTYTTYKGMLKDPDNEHRVFYVAATRARQNLYIHTPVTDKFYNMPR